MRLVYGMRKVVLLLLKLASVLYNINVLVVIYFTGCGSSKSPDMLFQLFLRPHPT
jgi:hypothetical protein